MSKLFVKGLELPEKATCLGIALVRKLPPYQYRSAYTHLCRTLLSFFSLIAICVLPSKILLQSHRHTSKLQLKL